MLASAEVHLFPNGVPNYFSGTNCRVFADAVVTSAPTQGFTNVTIFINSEWVAKFETDMGVVAMQHASTAAMFDSTHFQPGTTVAVWATATDQSGGVWSSQTYFIPVKNKMHLFGRYDLEVDPLNYTVDPTTGDGEYSSPPWWVQPNPWAGAIPIRDLYEQSIWSFYSFYLMTLQGWSALTYHVTLQTEQINVAYVNSHGGVNGVGENVFFESDANDFHFYYPNPAQPQNQKAQESMYGLWPYVNQQESEVHPDRVSANGVGLPPFNSGAPPISLAFVDGCESAHGWQTFFDGYLYPYSNAYSYGVMENQVLIGWLSPVNIGATRQTATRLFEILHQGNTIRSSVITLNNEVDTGSYLKYVGDRYTRISGVYDPFGPEPAIGWKRGL